MGKLHVTLLFIFTYSFVICQVHPDSSFKKLYDTTFLRIKNLNPYFTIHVDSTLRYQVEIDKDITNYY